MFHISYDRFEEHCVECENCTLHMVSDYTEAKAVARWNDHPMHKSEEIVRLQTGFIRIIHEVKAGATDVEVLAICREMLGFREEE